MKRFAQRPELSGLAFAFLISTFFCLTQTSRLVRAEDVPDDVRNWTYWRGPYFDGTSPTTNLPDKWSPKGGPGSNLLWKSEEYKGRSTPVIFEGRLYTTVRDQPGTPREGEKVVCLDAKSGELIWENRFNVWLSDVPDTRVGWPSVTVDPETGYVYCLGVCDYFVCIDGKTGKTVWGLPLHEQFGMLSTYGGRTNFPVVFEDLVIVSGVITNWGDRARPNHRFIGFDKRTGECRWFNGTVDQPDDTTYSGPSIVTLNGEKLLVIGVGDGACWAMQPRTGKTVAHYAISRRGLFTTPLVDGNIIYAGHSEENVNNNTMGSVEAIQLEGQGSSIKVKSLWRDEELMIGRAAPLLIDGRLYVLTDSCKLFVLDAKTGEPIAERIAVGDRKQYGCMLYADGKIYVLTENGMCVILKPTHDGAEVVSKTNIRGEAFNSTPVVADGRLYFIGNTALYCVGFEDAKEATFDPKLIKQQASETPIADHSEPAWVQVVPAEALVNPGESIEFKVRLFNELGQPLDALGSADIQLTVAGPGKVDGLKFTANEDAGHEPVMVTATVGKLKGESRVRVVPPLPWKFSFDELKEPPSTWVGARYRHIIKPIDGSPALAKIVTIPKGARSRAWFGPSDLSNYTITADVKGSKTGDNLPDIGLIGQGYEMVLMGNSQQLQIRTWTATLRMAKETPYAWYADRWYRLKLRSSVEQVDGKQIAVLRGKVWPREEDEPEAWTVKASDETPQLTGSPGLYGNAQVTELYYDNLEVTPND